MLLLRKVHRAVRIGPIARYAMDRPRPNIPVDLLLIVAVNVLLAVGVYYLIVLWGLLEG